MRKITVFIATSLDGYIAAPDGGVDWLFTDADYGYAAFYDSVDIILMGRRTFEQLLTFGPYPYAGKECFVFASQPADHMHECAQFVSEDVGAYVRALQQRPGRGIWLVGGAGLIQQFVEEDLVDEWVISLHPVLLGDGLRLFSGAFPRAPLHLQGVQHYDSGLVQLHYLRHEPPT